MKILCMDSNSLPEVKESIKNYKKYAVPGAEVEIKSIIEAPSGIENYHDVAISERYLLG